MQAFQSEMEAIQHQHILYECSVNCLYLVYYLNQGESLVRPHILHVYIIVLTGRYICGFHWHFCLPFSFPLSALPASQSSRFIPRGAIVLNRWIHLRSTLFLMVNDAWLLGGFLMNSRMLIVMSKMPL